MVYGALRTGKMLEVPAGAVLPLLFASFGLSYGAIKLGQHYAVLPHTYSPEFLAESNKIGPIAPRLEVPSVFLNPIRNGIPGSVLGPDDLIEADEE